VNYPQSTETQSEVAAAPGATSNRIGSVMPALLALAVAVALLAVLSPEVRRQIKISVTKQPTPYFELYFPRADVADGGKLCRHGRKAVHVSFVIASHLLERKSVPFRIVIDPQSRQGKTVTREGVVRSSPSTSSAVARSIKVSPKAGYDLLISLPESGQRLIAHCPRPQQ
jgi:hypothetical protein